MSSVKIVLEAKPKLIIAGGSAYSRQIDFKKMAEVAHEVDAIFMVDMAHFAGLVAAGLHPNPVEYADIVLLQLMKTVAWSSWWFDSLQRKIC